MYLRTKPPSRLTLSRSVLTSGPETRLLGSLDPFSPTSNGLRVIRDVYPRTSLDRAEKLTRKHILLKFFVQKGITFIFIGEEVNTRSTSFLFFEGEKEGMIRE